MFSIGDIAKEVYLRIDQGEEAGIPKLKKSGIYDILKAAFDVIGQAVVSGENVSIPQFGKFMNETQKEKMARNPKTGEKIKVPQKQVPKFRVSSVFRQAVIDGDNSPSGSEKKKVEKKKKGKKK